MKIATIVGARPQFIKMVPVSCELRKRKHDEVIIHTGQHLDNNMSAIFFKELDIPEPGVVLQRLADIGGVLKEINPELVLVYGDTMSSMLGAFFAKQECFPVMHIEAGLRSNNKKMAEEAIRIMVDHASDILCCPTESAVKNLEMERVEGSVFLTGDVLRECFFKYLGSTMRPLGSEKDSYILASIHRAENVDDPDRLESCLKKIEQVSIEKQLPVILPIHPRTEKNLTRQLHSNIKIMPPVSYLEMISLEQFAELIITDSGGVQREAHWLCKECILLRNETEWVEFDNGNIARPSLLIVNIMEGIK